MKYLTLIDGDMLAYRSLLASCKTEYQCVDDTGEIQQVFPAGRDADGKTGAAKAREWAESNEWVKCEVVKQTLEPPMTHVLYLINQTLDNVHNQFPGKMRIFLSDSPTFRHRLYPEYKANRPEKPRMLPEVMDLLKEQYGAETMPDLEADDAFGLVYDSDIVYVSSDKDIRQYPGDHFNPYSGEQGELIKVGSEAAYLNLWQQVLMGDSTDNIPGIKGIGWKKSERMLMGAFMDGALEEVPQIAYDIYCDNNLGLEDMLLTYRLVYLIRRIEEKELDWTPEWVDALELREEDCAATG